MKNKLIMELMNDIANGSVKFSNDSELYKLINKKVNDYLGQFSGRIDSSVNNLYYTADNDVTKFNQLSDNIMKKITTAGDNELNDLVQRINQNLNQQQVDRIVQSAINNHVAKVTGKSASQVNAYFSALNNYKSKARQLSNKADKLFHRLDNDEVKLNNYDKQFWYGIATAIILTACVCWIFL